MFRRSFASSRQLQQPRALLRLAVAQRVRLGWLGGLEGLNVDNILPQKIASFSPDGHGPIVLAFRPTKTISTSCRRSSMRKWRNCTSLLSTVLTQEQADYIDVKVEGLSKVGTTVIQMQDSFESVVAGSVFDSVQRWRKSQRRRLWPTSGCPQYMSLQVERNGS